MLDLIICEFTKLKRLKFIQLSLLAAFLFPLPLTILMAKDEMAFDQLFRANLMFGELLLLPCILGIISSTLFFMERDNETLKNLVTIPISKTKIVLTKLLMITILSVLYSVVGLGASVIGGFIVGSVEGVLYRLGISILLGILVAIASLPIILVIVYFSKSFIFSIIVSFVYAIIGFVITMMFTTSPEMMNPIASVVPIPIILKWYLTLFPLEEALSYIEPYSISTIVCFGIMTVYAIIFVYLSTFVYKKIEI